MLKVLYSFYLHSKVPTFTIWNKAPKIDENNRESKFNFLLENNSPLNLPFAFKIEADEIYSVRPNKGCLEKSV